MAEWHLGDFGSVLPSEFSSFASDFDDLINDIEPTFEAVLTALGILSDVLSGSGPIDWIATLKTFIENLKSQLLGAGFYYLSCWDYALREFQKESAIPGFSSSTTFDDFLDAMIVSFNDEFDEERPLHPTGTVGAFILAVGATSGEDFLKLWESVVKLWPSNKELTDLQNEFLSTVRGIDDEGYPAPYNWSDKTSSDLLTYYLPEAAEFLDIWMTNIIRSLEVAGDAGVAMKKLIGTVAKKITRLKDILEQLNQLISSIQTMLTASGIHVLFVKASGGITGLKTAIKKSTSKPFGSSQVYVSGCMFVVGGAELALFEELFGNV